MNSFTACYKKLGGSRLIPRNTEYQKQKKINKLWQKLSSERNAKF